MEALDYEYLIRRIHKCARYGVEGADADIFRNLESNHVIYTTELEAIQNGTPRRDNRDINILAYKYGVSVGKVVNNIVIAISKFQSDYENQLSEDQKVELENCEGELLEPTLEAIDNVIERVLSITNDLGIMVIE